MIVNKDPIMIFVFMCLLKQADTWSTVLTENTSHKTKFRFANWNTATKALINELSPHIDMEWLEENSQVFSDILHLLASETDVRKKMELIGALKAFVAGDITIVDEPADHNEQINNRLDAPNT